MKKRLFALALSACLLAGTLVGCTPANEGSTSTPTPPASPAPVTPSSFTYADTIAWDGQYDVVVIGAGFAGATAAIAAADEGAKVLLTEKAPEAEAGGNSRVCHQLFATVHDAEGGFQYYSDMRGEFESTSDSMLMTLMNGMTGLRDYVISLGANPDTITGWNDKGIVTYACEHPELSGTEHFEAFTITDQVADGALFRLVKENLAQRAENLDIWYESPAVHLVQDPQSKTILGVQIERGGETLNIRALNGVVMACGGFENNSEMLENYLRLGGETTFHGSAYNTGDGVRMAQEVGAQMWHMSNHVSGGVAGSLMPATNPAITSLAGAPAVGATILVGPDGTRFVNEEGILHARHGSINVAGSYLIPHFPDDVYGIFDESKVKAFKMEALIEPELELGYLVKADTIEELAEKLGATHLADTVSIYNRYCAEGKDEMFRRDPSNLIPFGEGPYYAYDFTVNAILNTQGGAKRNENAEVIGLSGDPIPHLYSAGEFGGITARTYQGGTNVAECLVFGPIAGRNAAAKKDPLPALVLSPVDSDLVYVPGHTTDLTPEKTYNFEVAEGQYLGVSGKGMGGDIVVRVTMDGDKIAKVEVMEQHETEGIADKALSTLPDAIVAAQSTEVDSVSGATITSVALLEAVQDALNQAK